MKNVSNISPENFNILCLEKFKMKVVGIGLNKTGTNTLMSCLSHLGFRHQTYSNEAFKLWLDKDYSSLMQWVASFDSFEDWPWPLLYKEIDKTFEGSKFILTIRKDPETWFKSLCNHADRTGPTDFRKYIYGYDLPYEHKQEHINFYEKHLQSVHQYFKNRPDDLLEICWENGDSWAKLSNFLNLETPNIPLPHRNKSSK